MSEHLVKTSQNNIKPDKISVKQRDKTHINIWSSRSGISEARLWVSRGLKCVQNERWLVAMVLVKRSMEASLESAERIR